MISLVSERCQESAALETSVSNILKRKETYACGGMCLFLRSLPKDHYLSFFSRRAVILTAQESGSTGGGHTASA